MAGVKEAFWFRKPVEWFPRVSAESPLERVCIFSMIQNRVLCGGSAQDICISHYSEQTPLHFSFLFFPFIKWRGRIKEEMNVWFPAHNTRIYMLVTCNPFVMNIHCSFSASAGIVQPEIKRMSSFTHLHAVPNPYDFLSSLEHKRRCLAECLSRSFPFNDEWC